MWIGITQGSVQAEGAGSRSDWYGWEKEGRAPPSNDGTGFGVDFANDFALYQSLGHTHVRITAEWARIEPADGKINTDELDRYRDILAAARHAGLEPIVTLVSTSLPGWFHDDEGGFLDDKSLSTRWVGHVERCAAAFEGLVAGWVGIDDPIGWAIRAYGTGTRPPGRQDPHKALDAVEAALNADRLAAAVLGSGDAPVISSFGLPTVFGVGPESATKAQWWDGLFWNTWIGAVRDGELVIPHRPPGRRDEFVGIYDVIGFTHSHPIGVDGEGRFCRYPIDGEPDDSGFSPTPPELGEALRRLDSELPGQKLLLTGLGVSTDDDDFRDSVLADVADEIEEAVSDGVAIEGWLHDTGIDGYEWTAGFDHRRGIADRDRNPKPSATRLT